MSQAQVNAKEVATELLTCLNADNDCNYPYTEKQFELLCEAIEHLATCGVAFDETFYDRCIYAPAEYDEAEDKEQYEELFEVLDDIFNGVDENGAELPEREQSFHFDPTPYPIKN